MSPLARRVAAPLAGVVACALLFLAARGFDRVVPGDQLGPGFWPRIALAGLSVTCLAKIAGELRRARPRSDAVAGSRSPIAAGGLAAAIAAIFLYVIAAPLLGFPLTTAVFIAAFTALGGMRSIPAIAATAVGGTVALLYLFVKLVYLPLPKGQGAFEAATLALYRALRIF